MKEKKDDARCYSKVVLEATMSLKSITTTKARGAVIAGIGLVGQMLRLDMAIEIVTTDKVPVAAGLGALVGTLTIVGVDMRPEIEGTRERLVAALERARMHALLDRV